MPKVAAAASAKATPAPMRCHCAAAPRPDAAPNTSSASARPTQHHRHRQHDAALGPVGVEQARPERRPERIGVEGEQGERDRQARDRRIEAQALHADEQADRRQRAPVPRRVSGTGTRCATSSAPTTSAVTVLRTLDRRRDVDAVVEGDARRDVVGAHHQRDQEQRRERSAGKRARAAGADADHACAAKVAARTAGATASGDGSSTVTRQSVRASSGSIRVAECSSAALSQTTMSPTP